MVIMPTYEEFCKWAAQSFEENNQQRKKLEISKQLPFTIAFQNHFLYLEHRVQILIYWTQHILQIKVGLGNMQGSFIQRNREDGKENYKIYCSHVQCQRWLTFQTNRLRYMFLLTTKLEMVAILQNLVKILPKKDCKSAFRCNT